MLALGSKVTDAGYGCGAILRELALDDATHREVLDGTQSGVAQLFLLSPPIQQLGPHHVVAGTRTTMSTSSIRSICTGPVC